jgi:hypothetical protein
MKNNNQVSANTETSDNLDASVDQNHFEYLDALMEAEEEILGFGDMTGIRCLEIGDALAVERKKSPSDFRTFLQGLRLTPLAARQYESISRSSLLRRKLSEKGTLVDVEPLARIARLPDALLNSFQLPDADLCCGSFIDETMSRIQLDGAIHDGLHHGWPRVSVQPGERWILTLLPTQMGIRGSFFVRVCLHTFEARSVVCPRLTDAKLGGRSTAACPICDDNAGASKYEALPEGVLAPVPFWATYCLVAEINNGDCARFRFQERGEPWLLMLDESSFYSVVGKSFDHKSTESFSPVVLSVKDGKLISRNCSKNDYLGDINPFEDFRFWAEALHEPAEFRVSALDDLESLLNDVRSGFNCLPCL